MHLQKTCLLLQLFWLDLALFATGATFNGPHVRRDTVPALNASIAIRDQSGNDVTPSFKIMVRTQDQDRLLENQTMNGLHDRQAFGGRVINSCSNGQTFVQSQCAPNELKGNSLQRYIYTCKKNITSPRPGPQMARFRSREGFCADDELCFDIRTDDPALTIASCSRRELFQQWHVTKDGKLRPMVDGEIFDPIVSVYGIASKADGNTPLEMGSLSLNAWNGEGATKDEGQSKTCRECAEIETGFLTPEADSLRLEAKLMAGASAAATGVLWLTLLTAGK